MKKANLGELNALYTQADSVDREVYAEMRSNLLLVAGEHYSKSAIQNYRTHIRESRDLSDMQKLRLTKNHIHRVHRRYTQAISRYASGITVSPQTDNEVQDQKSADLNLSVLRDIQYRHKWTEKVRKWIDDFVDIGEVAVKVFWDPQKGDFVGYAHKKDELTDEFQFDEDGAPVADELQPIFKGDFEFERLYGFNLWRDTACKDMESSRFLGVRKMHPTAKLKARYQNDPDKLKFLQNDQNEEFIVFDSTRSGYDRSKGMSLLREIYYRPGEEFPNGYFVIWTKAGILEEGELPFGIFPIEWKGFDEHASAPRGRSIIKQARPFQAEINRASSAQAQAQITIGDDKILYQQGSKLAPGALLPGVRGIAYQGKEPTVLPGRDGGQYLPYIVAQIDELDKVLDLDELEVEVNGQLDPYALLFRASREREKFSRYSTKFEEFHIALIRLTLELSRRYYPDDMLVPAIGSKEYVNIEEFRSTVPQCYRIHVEAEDESLETKFGRQLSINHVLQYASSSLDKDDIGKLVRNMPFANAEESFSDLTIDYDLARNDILALERGKFQPAEEDDNHPYMIKKLSQRMRQADFQFLNPQVQRIFVIKKQQHMQLQAVQEQKVIDMKNEYIPTDGPMIAADMYIQGTDPTKEAKRVRIPQNAVDWLLKKLQAQGQDQQTLESMSTANMAQLAGLLNNRRPGPTQQGQPAGPPMPMGGPGQARPMLPQGVAAG